MSLLGWFGLIIAIDGSRLQKLSLGGPFKSQAWAKTKPQARPITRSVRKTKIMQNSPMFSKNASDLIVFHPASLSFEILEKILLTLQQASGTVNYFHYKIVDWHFRKYYVLIKCMELTCFLGFHTSLTNFLDQKICYSMTHYLKTELKKLQLFFKAKVTNQPY